MIPEAVTQAREDICATCPTPCVERAALDLTDACAACPIDRWHKWDCGAAAEPEPPAVKPRRRKTQVQPGDTLHFLIKRVTGAEPVGNCQCLERMAKMNAWGWFGCWIRRWEIIGWLAEEATKRGHTIPEAEILPLFRAALSELQERRRGHAAAQHQTRI